MPAPKHLLKTSLFCLPLFLMGCSGVSSDDDPQGTTNDLASTDIVASIVKKFDAGTIIGTPKTVPCTLSGGTQTECLSITLPAAPTTFKVGPWCPTNISDGPEVSGIWLKDGQVYDADGAFIQNLPTLYKGDAWKLFDPKTGKVNVTNSKMSCAAAARPDVAEEYQNHCVQCELSYLEDGLTQTYVIPLTPIAAKTIAPRVDHAGVGFAFSGVRLEAAAPVADILRAHTLAPFDDCGGHVNLHVGYHLHAVTDCLSEVAVNQNKGAQIGLAMDGYSILSRFNPDGVEPKDLDVCRGHITQGLGYHYHANAAGANAILPCHTGQTGCSLDSADASCDASQNMGPPQGARPQDQGQRPDREAGVLPPGFSEAATKLGVTEQALMQAVQNAGGRNLDFAAAAKALGVSEAKLKATLPPPPSR